MNVMTTILEAIAGSAPSFFITNGTIAPATPLKQLSLFRFNLAHGAGRDLCCPFTHGASGQAQRELAMGTPSQQ